MSGVQGVSVVCGFEIVGKGHCAACGLALAQGLQLGSALGDQLVFINGYRRGVGHGELRVSPVQVTNARLV
jgi:hypothetical protein